MPKKNNLRKQLKSIRRETNNPAIIADVIDTEFGIIPDNIESIGNTQNRMK